MNHPHLVRKTTSPITPPPEAGIHWINEVTHEEYFSVGTSAASDWVKRISSPRRLEIAINQSMIDNKKVNLPHPNLDPEKVALTFLNGIEQLNGTDFEVELNYLKWENLGLDGFIEVGDIIIIYF